jgi:PEP-CTERM motif
MRVAGAIAAPEPLFLRQVRLFMHIDITRTFPKQPPLFEAAAQSPPRDGLAVTLQQATGHAIHRPDRGGKAHAKGLVAQFLQHPRTSQALGLAGTARAPCVRQVCDLMTAQIALNPPKNGQMMAVQSPGHLAQRLAARHELHGQDTLIGPGVSRSLQRSTQPAPVTHNETPLLRTLHLPHDANLIQSPFNKTFGYLLSVSHQIFAQGSFDAPPPTSFPGYSGHYHGDHTIIYYAPSDTDSSAPAAGITLSSQSPSLSIQSVPEPSTIALAGMGAFVAAICLRRKR